jgi:hypothetical protein
LPHDRGIDPGGERTHPCNDSDSSNDQTNDESYETADNSESCGKNESG